MRSTALTVFCLLVATLGTISIAPRTARARAHPDRPRLTAGPQAVVSATGEFNCGTWRDTGNGVHWHESRRIARLKEIQISAVATIDSIYDDVWVIEDDGTLTISGKNVFDTQATTFRFTPDGSGYNVTTVLHAFNPFEFGENLMLGDDDEAIRTLPFTFPYYGTDWTEIRVGSNGGISFGAPLNPSGFFVPEDFFSATPKITPYFLDLDPTGATGTQGVLFRSEGDSVVITWSAVNEFGVSHKNSFQIILRSDGTFDFVMITIQSDADTGSGGPFIMGIHPGGTPLLERISFSDDLPYTGGAGSGIYEDFLNIVNPIVNETALGRRFYQNFPDEFFQYVFFTNFVQTMGGFANEFNISNDVTGIGLSIYDNSSLYGSSGVLESRCNMNQLGAWVTDPTVRFRGTQSFLTIMGQESGHRWGAFTYFLDSSSQPSNLMLGRADAHWSYYSDVDHSCLEGGNWIETSPGTFLCPDNVDMFSELDEYLFGLRSPEEVSDMLYVSSSSNNQLQNRDNPPPPAGSTAFGTAIPVSVYDFIAHEGLRTPLPAAENKDLRQAFIYLLKNGTTPTQAQLDKVANFRRAWEDYFEVSCDGRLTCNTSLTQAFVAAAVEGHVRDSQSGQPIDEIVVFSRERGFRQHVPGGGRYTFRYLENETSGSAETVTLVAQAPGYLPDSLTTSINYGDEIMLDIQLDRDPAVSVAITAFDVRVVSGTVELSARFISTWGLVEVNVYRSRSGTWKKIDTVSHEGPGEFHYVDRTAAAGESYRYMIGVVDPDGEFFSIERGVRLPSITASLAQNVPNPFNPTTRIGFMLAERTGVRLSIYDPSGRLVVTLVDEVRGQGSHSVVWDGRDNAGNRVGSGVYFYRLTAGRFHATRKMILIK